ncbi:hypothetical protein J6590_019752 [Homalodisca vitripennis]|nr:hypothetical protein J6590_019752 [Homalodisca vitripennis]
MAVLACLAPLTLLIPFGSCFSARAVTSDHHPEQELLKTELEDGRLLESIIVLNNCGVDHCCSPYLQIQILEPI